MCYKRRGPSWYSASVNSAVFLCVISLCPCWFPLLPLLFDRHQRAGEQLTQTAIQRGWKCCWDWRVCLDSDSSSVLWLHIHLAETQQGSASRMKSHIMLAETLWLAFIVLSLLHLVFGVDRKMHTFIPYLNEYLQNDKRMKIHVLFGFFLLWNWALLCCHGNASFWHSSSGYWRLIAHLPHVGSLTICARCWHRIYVFTWAAAKTPVLHGQINLSADLLIYHQPLIINLPRLGLCTGAAEKDYQVLFPQSRIPARCPAGDRANLWVQSEIDPSNKAAEC